MFWWRRGEERESTVATFVETMLERTGSQKDTVTLMEAY